MPSPEMARMIIGEEPSAIVGSSKLYLTNWGDVAGEGEKIGFGGVLMDNQHNGLTNGRWRMAAATVIILPGKIYEWKDGPCGYRIDQLMTGHTQLEDWKEIKT